MNKSKPPNKWIAIIAILLGALTNSSRLYVPSHPHAIYRKTCTVSPQILWGLAWRESDLKYNAIGPDGHDQGLFQYRDYYNKERGIEDPFDTVEVTNHTIKELEANRKALGSMRAALAAHNRGFAAIKRDGWKSAKAYVLSIEARFKR